VKQRIGEAGNRLGAATTGRPARIVGLYEKSVPKTSYIILYALPNQQSVLILDVVHASRNWPNGAWPPA
jgi:plasmid stabilization system protein ParE